MVKLSSVLGTIAKSPLKSVTTGLKTIVSPSVLKTAITQPITSLKTGFKEPAGKLISGIALGSAALVAAPAAVGAAIGKGVVSAVKSPLKTTLGLGGTILTAGAVKEIIKDNPAGAVESIVGAGEKIFQKGEDIGGKIAGGASAKDIALTAAGIGGAAVLGAGVVVAAKKGKEVVSSVLGASPQVSNNLLNPKVPTIGAPIQDRPKSSSRRKRKSPVMKISQSVRVNVMQKNLNRRSVRVYHGGY